jgi:hypothetical protein
MVFTNADTIGFAFIGASFASIGGMDIREIGRPSFAVPRLPAHCRLMKHRIDILPRPNDAKHGPEPVAYHGKVIGKSKEPILTAARWLLENNAASPDDRIETYRNGKLSLSGIVGECAKWTVRERDDGKPSLSLTRWKAFPHETGCASTDVNARTAENGSEAA